MRFQKRLPALLLFAATGLSAQGLNFTATLDSIKIYGRPGQLVNRNFRLTLGELAPVTQFHASVGDFWRSEDGKQSFYAGSGTLSRSCGAWVSLNPVEATLNASESLNVRVSVAIPEAVEPGGYWCALTVDQLRNPNEPPGEGVRVNFLASVSVGIYVFIDPLDRTARITDVTIQKDEASLTLFNGGNTPLGVEGRFEFVGPDNGKPVVVKIPRQTALPEPIRTAILSVPLPPPEVLPSGDYLVRVIVDVGLDHYIGVQKKLEVRR